MPFQRLVESVSWLTTLRTGSSRSRTSKPESRQWTRVPKPGVTKDSVELASERTTPEALLSHLLKSNSVVRSDFSRMDKNRVMDAVTTHDCPVCSTFSGSNCFLLSASANLEQLSERLATSIGTLSEILRRG